MSGVVQVCPECHGQRFSWIAELVQFGDVVEYDTGTVEESKKRGDYVGDDTDEEGVFCVDCGESRDQNDLIPVQVARADEVMAKADDVSEELRETAVNAAIRAVRDNLGNDVTTPEASVYHSLNDAGVPMGVVLSVLDEIGDNEVSGR